VSPAVGSPGLNLIVGHAALSADCRLVLVDGKQVELGAWRDCADEFVGPDIDHANKVLAGLRQEMDDRYDALLDAGRRKVSRESGVRYWPRAASLAVFGRTTSPILTCGRWRSWQLSVGPLGTRRECDRGRPGGCPTQAVAGC
jgi:hypothetical protein